MGGADRVARSDAEGRFLLRGVNEALFLSATKAGFCRTRFSIEPKGEDDHWMVRVPLVEGGVVEGSVRSSEGAPVSGAIIDVLSFGAADLERLRVVCPRIPVAMTVESAPFPPRPRTEEDGSFRLTGLLPAAVLHHVYCGPPETGSSQEVSQIRFGYPGEHRVLGIPVLGSADVHGTLTLNGAPSPGHVRWKSRDGAGEVETDRDGGYRISGPLRGSVRIVGAALVPGNPKPLDGRSVLAEVTRDLVVTEGDDWRVDLDVQADLSEISGTIRGATGEPRGRIPVRLLGPDGELVYSALSDEDGELRVLVPASIGTAFRVVVEVGPTRVEAPAIAGGAPFSLKVANLGLVVAHVLRPNGERVLRPGFRWRAAGASAWESVSSYAHVRPRSDGAYQVVLPVGELDLQATDVDNADQGTLEQRVRVRERGSASELWFRF